MSAAGLLIITLSWLIQYRNKKKSLSPLFLVVYLGGVLCLIYDGIVSGLGVLAALNTVSFLAAALVLYRSVVKP